MQTSHSLIPNLVRKEIFNHLLWGHVYMSIVIGTRKLWSFELFSKYSLSMDAGLGLVICCGQRKSLKWACTMDIALLYFWYCDERKPLQTGMQDEHMNSRLSPLGPKEPSPGRQKASNTAIHLSQDQQNYSAELQILSIDPIIVCHWDFVTIMKQFHTNNGLTTEAHSGNNICVWFRVEVKIGEGDTTAKIR